MMRRQTFSTGTGLLTLLRLASSPRQSNTFIRMKNAAISTNRHRDNIGVGYKVTRLQRGTVSSGGGNLNGLADFEAVRIEAGVSGAESFQADTMDARDGSERIVGFDGVLPVRCLGAAGHLTPHPVEGRGRRGAEFSGGRRGAGKSDGN